MVNLARSSKDGCGGAGRYVIGSSTTLWAGAMTIWSFVVVVVDFVVI